MKIIALVCALFVFSFASDVSATASLDVKSCAYSEQNKTLAVYDAKNSLKILNQKDLKPISKFDVKTDEITSLAFDGANLYAGFASGEVAKFSDDFSSFAGMLNLSNLSLDTQITHLHVAKGKIYAVAGKDAFVSYDTKIGDNKLNVRLNGKNLTNRLYYTSTVGSSAQYPMIAIGNPREISVSAKFEF